jgi:hypothetical protein
VAHNQIFITVGHLWSSCCGAPSLTRGRVCNLLAQFAVTLGLTSQRPYDILLSHLRLLQPGGPGPNIYIPQEKGGQVIPPGTGFPFVASYDSQGYGGGILTCFNTGVTVIEVEEPPNGNVGNFVLH